MAKFKKWYGKRYGKKSKSHWNLEKVARKVKRLEHAAELKYYNLYPTGMTPLTTAPAERSMFQTALGGTNVPAAGTGVSGRIGKSIMVRSLEVVINAYSPVATNFKSGTNPNYLRGAQVDGDFDTGVALVAAAFDPAQLRSQFRMLILSYRGRVASADNSATFLDVISGNSYPTYMFNRALFAEGAEYRVLKDKLFTYSLQDSGAGSEIIRYKVKFPKGHIVTYDDTNGTIDDGDIRVMLYSDTANSSNAWTFYLNCQIMYNDS